MVVIVGDAIVLWVSLEKGIDDCGVVRRVQYFTQLTIGYAQKL